MKIIHYVGSLRFGGIERLVYDLVSQQIKRDTLDIAIGVGNLKGEFKAQFENLGVTLNDFNLSSGFDLNPSKIIKITRCFKNYDVIHLHGFHISVGISAIISTKKIIYTEHGNFGFGRVIKTSDKLSFFLRKKFFRYSKVSICANSEFTKSLLEKRFYKGKRLKVICNGSNFNTSYNQQLFQKLKSKYSNFYVVGVVGRLAGVKRIDKVIQMFSEYIKQNKMGKLLILGDGVERENLVQLVNKLKIVDYVEFLGYQKSIATYQSIFNACILGSKNEAFGLVTIESYLQKTPVLAFKDGGGVVEIIKKFEAKDVCDTTEAMIDRLIYYNDNAFQWTQNMSEQLDFFSIERMEVDYYNEYQKALSFLSKKN